MDSLFQIGQLKPIYLGAFLPFFGLLLVFFPRERLDLILLYSICAFLFLDPFFIVSLPKTRELKEDER